MRPTGPGTHSIAVEPYRGVLSRNAFFRELDAAETILRLQRVIEVFQPELTYHLIVPGSAMHLGSSGSLVSTWCDALERDTNLSLGLEQAVDKLLVSLEQALDSRRLTHRVVTSIAGLKLQRPETVVVVGNGITIRSLSAAELVELGAQDIMFGQGHDVISHSVTCCIEIESICSFSLEQNHPMNLLVSEAMQDAASITANVLRALHVLKPGRAGIFLTQTEMSPMVFPYLSCGSSWPSNRPLFASLDLIDAELDNFLLIERGLRETSREELRIASDRLVDAESRLSPVDSLLDAVIGLEVLLNPMDSSELAFRVALNYAFLAAPELRRARYDRVRLLQKTRNRVVHGGLNLKSPVDSATIQEHANLAKACLRDTLMVFLLDENLKGNQKLDANFWLDRVLPADIVDVQVAIPRQQ